MCAVSFLTTLTLVLPGWWGYMLAGLLWGGMFLVKDFLCRWVMVPSVHVYSNIILPTS